MDNRVNELRRIIRALRISMREAETIMGEQISRDEDCSFVARELMKMRTVMSGLVRERTSLGDAEPILIGSAFTRRRAPVVRLPRPAIRRLLPPAQTMTA